MKVVAVVDGYLPAAIGAYIATHRFLTHLQDRGHDVTVFVRRSRSKSYTLDGLTVETGLRGRSHAFRLAQSADVVIAHAGDGGFGIEVAETTGRPLVRMVHGHGYGDHQAALAVFNSRSLLDAARPGCPAIVCHPPTPVAAYQVDRSEADAVTIVNLTDDKGIRTAWRMADAHQHRRFLGVQGGYGYQRPPRCRNFETLPTQRDMRTVYAQTRVLLVPSIFETWGMVAVEAMCSGIPVIAHPTPGLVESLGSAGIFADRDDTGAWLAELDRLDDPAEYARASTAALERATELDPAPDLARFAEAVEALCGSSSPVPAAAVPGG